MQISVVIIAHNEEKYISKCIESILNQTQKADEIILVVHNSNDSTYEIVQNYPIKILKLDGEPGIINARIYGISNSTKDIILCIDGDSFAKNNWIEEMNKTLNSHNNVLVGSWVKFRGTFFGSISNISNKKLCKTSGADALRWLWGPSFCFYQKDKKNVIEIFNKSLKLSKELGLSRNPDDLWLALFMSKIGNIEITNNTYVTQNQKENNTVSAIKRNFENIKNANKTEKFFKENKNLI